MNEQKWTVDIINVERPAAQDVTRLRHVVLIGPSGGGKSTLVEALGGVPRPEGPTRTLNPCTVEVDGVTIWLLDTPGDPDFGGWVTAGVRGADAALFVLPAGRGISPMTQRLWKQCADADLPRAIVLTHLDDPDTDFDDAVALAERIFGEGVVPTHLPLYDGEPGLPGAPVGVIDVLLGTLSDHSGGERTGRPADEEHLRLLRDVRTQLVESIMANSEDDQLVDRHLDDGDVDSAALVAELDSGVRSGVLHPIVAAVPPTGVGCTEIGRLLAHGFPSPLVRRAPAVSAADGSPRAPLHAERAGPLAGEVITRLDPPLALVRLYSGELRDGSAVEAGGVSVTVRLPHHATTAVAGELVVVVGLDAVPVGATLSADSASLSADSASMTLEPWPLPPTSVRVELPGFMASWPEHMAALDELTAADPAVRADFSQSHAVKLWCVGVRHADQALATLTDRVNLRRQNSGFRYPQPTRPPASQREFGQQGGTELLVHLEVSLPDALVGTLLRHLPSCEGTRLSSLPGDDGDDAVVTVELPEAFARFYVAEVRELTDGTAAVSEAGRRAVRHEPFIH